MTHMRARWTPGLLVAVIALIAATPAVAAAGRCGRLEVTTRDAKAKVRVVRGRTTCAAARRQIAAAFHAEDTLPWSGYANPYGVYWRVRGWRCFIGLAGSQTFCHRRRSEVDGSLRTDDGWSF